MAESTVLSEAPLATTRPPPVVKANSRTSKPSEDSDIPTASSHDFYRGLSERSKLWILALGALIACANLMVAWFLAQETLHSLRLVDSDMTPFKILIGDQQFSNGERHDLTARSMHVVALSKLVANKQGLVLACFGGAFALAAIGFSLFVIGADGAFKVSSTTSAKAGIVLSGTAPGLLCFLICGWLIQEGVKHRSELNLPPFTSSLYLVQPASQAEPASSAEDSCAKLDGFGKCHSRSEWDKEQKK